MGRAWISLLFAMALGGAPAAEVHVGAGQPHATLHGAVAAARDGDTLVVHGGVYQEGNLRVDKALALVGMAEPVIDGARACEVVTVTASGVSIKGFVIRNSGVSSLEDRAGIRVSEAGRVVVSTNRIEDCTFGIYLSKARDCEVTGNEVRGTPGNEQDSGNGIHLWSCDRVTVSDNHVSRHRDGIYLEFATDSRIERNTVEDNLRYGLHFMFSHRNAYRHNAFERNGAGVAVMYSREVEMSGNRFRHNWGSAAYGLLLKEMSDGRITDNLFEHNTTGICMHGSSRMTVEHNRFRENGWAIQVQTSCSDNTFRRNDFSGNSFDLAANGQLDNHVFADNYWDKYEGYDLNRDGTGDVPYRPVSLYAVVVDRVPASILLMRSPVVHLLDQAERAFPSITPERVADEAPAMRRHPFADACGPPRSSRTTTNPDTTRP